MKFRSIVSRSLGLGCVGSSLVLLLVTAVCFWRQPDRFAAFTVVPIWLWGICGLLPLLFAAYFLRTRHSLKVVGLWMITLLFGADEAQVLFHFGKSPPLPGPAAAYQSKPVVRVITLNCNMGSYGDVSPDLAAWQPDVVLLQEILPHQARRIATALFGGAGEVRSYRTNAIVTRWKFKKVTVTPSQPDQQATLRLPNGAEIEIVNVHLATAATDLRLWRRSAWVNHRNNRVARRQELAFTHKLLRTTTDFPNLPVLFGGDFNAPASDPVFRQLTPDFRDAFAVAGTGWGDTFQRRLPILRIDHIFATPHFTPVRCRVVVTRHSDHRMVVADFLTDPPLQP
jgi:endonuclease/exonuclease/phosphatase (EEP) superfamily protein YafD